MRNTLYFLLPQFIPNINVWVSLRDYYNDVSNLELWYIVFSAIMELIWVPLGLMGVIIFCFNNYVGVIIMATSIFMANICYWIDMFYFIPKNKK